VIPRLSPNRLFDADAQVRPLGRYLSLRTYSSCAGQLRRYASGHRI
jgi:hypothetical protein